MHLRRNRLALYINTALRMTPAREVDCDMYKTGAIDFALPRYFCRA